MACMASGHWQTAFALLDEMSQVAWQDAYGIWDLNDLSMWCFLRPGLVNVYSLLLKMIIKHLHLWLIYLVKDGECPIVFKVCLPKANYLRNRNGLNSDDLRLGVTVTV